MKNEFEPWTPPKIWAGGTAFIIGGGPSLKDMDLTPIHGHHVIGTNNAYQLGSWVDLCWFGDCRWYDWHRDRLLKFAGIKVTCCVRAGGKPGIKGMKRGKAAGIEKRPGWVSWNGNTGASAINVAYHLGAVKVVLLGFDMRQVGDDCNWHPEHLIMNPNSEKKKLENGGKSCYGRYLRKFPEIAKDAHRLKLEIVNATPGSALPDFPIVELKDVLANT